MKPCKDSVKTKNTKQEAHLLHKFMQIYPGMHCLDVFKSYI